MKRVLVAFFVSTVALPGVALAEWSITNSDANSYSLIKACGSKTEDWSIAGGTTKKLSIPAGATSCTIKLKDTSCTVKDGDACLIKSGKIANK
ncbi:MAG: hypothetical protein Q8P41_27190 [Pseudomonadota bacterium]|nr:hypothetical protein [Pseudomonadota bacterium]